MGPVYCLAYSTHNNLLAVAHGSEVHITAGDNLVAQGSCLSYETKLPRLDRILYFQVLGPKWYASGAL
jgi:hypothetical protein